MYENKKVCHRKLIFTMLGLHNHIIYIKVTNGQFIMLTHIVHIHDRKVIGNKLERTLEKYVKMN